MERLLMIKAIVDEIQKGPAPIFDMWELADTVMRTWKERHPQEAPIDEDEVFAGAMLQTEKA